MSEERNIPQKVSTQQKWLLRFFSGLFWVFLIATVFHIAWNVFVPTPAEWPGEGEFPANFTWQVFASALLRHLVLFNEHFQIVNVIDTINYAFLTMFVYNMRIDIKTAMENKKGRVPAEVYVEWAMGSLISGIIFSSARVAGEGVPKSYVYIIGIFIFAFVSLYFLYRLRLRLKEEK